MKAQPPAGQSQRLSELYAFGVLDTDPEEEFDDVVSLVARICDTPMALISLVDEDRQWFKARVGVDSSETPLDQSICAHAILSDDILEIHDTTLDLRTADNPLCCDVDGKVRFYAGAPLITETGQTIGTLCVLDTKPRHLNDTQRDTLRVLARQVMRQLELRRALRNETILRDEIDHRVKNSLQTVLSFVRIYRNRVSSAEAKEAFDAIARRVSSIAQLHTELYQTDGIDTVRLDSYLQRVAQLLKGQAPRKVQVRSEIAAVEVDARTAASFAMIISEFAANAFKHAFPAGRPGEVRITVTESDTGALHLECSDNGVGSLHSGTPPKTSDIVSIGTTLMESAADQIGAQMAMQATPDGYRLSLDLPKDSGSSAATEAVPSTG
ncbi:histidine kinase dimerization/phosphoacceptor domain -containing protein [Aestuariicoccus sp. MJ-SS9]|uniref:histidine kinase dimerization/phosphoacceptor domain -containing protein n=1 Tax=Aestuariicoccus sp. MJ-SS9 TaxID=3079855 RepID=UPI00290882D6|nr:histidine kinase dimerization/phosphoacceptor domain -containing protein [Aestuariicoccus sp. MJ-SS9]MDU8913016.1 histidine kinase dimerization/phosphoacceptor domain -containing protein [Aestuariicoccus sp. MJ-SS9]